MLHEELIGGSLTTIDLFDESSDSIAAWERGNFEAIILFSMTSQTLVRHERSSDLPSDTACDQISQ